MRFIEIAIRAMLFLIVHVLGVRVIPEVFHPVVRRVAVVMTDQHILRARSEERFSNQHGYEVSPSRVVHRKAYD